MFILAKKFKLIINLLSVVGLFCLSLSQAVGASNHHYLPLKTDLLIELELEKLATVAKMPVLARPYHIATVQRYLDKVQQSHPGLYARITRYLRRYKNSSDLTQLSIEASYNSGEDKVLPNARGRNSDSNIKGHIAGYYSLSKDFNLSLGGTIYDGSSGFIPHNTYLSYAGEYFQIDVGYKEIWLSPFQESAMQLSTQARPIARFAISSPTPISDWGLEYGLSFGKLESQQGILFDGVASPGRPGFLSMNLSFQPLDWWTVGGNRTFVFGGGERKVDAGRIWDAIIDPINSDNCGGQSELQDCNEETGNQQASLVNKFDVDWGIPLSLYIELAGEDTRNFKPYKLGNKSYNVGLFLPYLTQKSTALLEYQLVENGWYTHHIYPEGYRNDLHSIGHWWGDEKLMNDGIGARIITVKYTNELTDALHLDVKVATIDNQNFGDILEAQYDASIYQKAHEVTIGLNQLDNNRQWRYQLYFGEDVFGESFSRVSVEYRWQ